MSFPELGIKRHIMAFMVAFAIIAFGIIGFSRIGVEETPNVDFPFITVSTYLSGADSEVIDSTVTSILLADLNGIEGLNRISGNSRDNVSYVFLEFDLSKDVDVAFNEVQVKLNQSLGNLPKDADAPTITKASSNDEPVMSFVLYGDRTREQLSDYAKNSIIPVLSNVNGVANVDIYGNRNTYVVINLDSSKMANFAIGVNDVINAFNSSHIELPGGFLLSKTSDYSLKLDFEFRELDDLKNLIIKQSNSSYVRLKDIAAVELGSSPNSRRTYTAFLDTKDPNNTGNLVTLALLATSGASAFEIEKDVMELVNDVITPALQPGMKLKLTNNDVNFIRNAVNSLKSHLYEGVIITSLIVLLILANFRSTLIIAFSIPVSLLGAVAVMYAFGYTFNILTLLALLLLIGVVVDDSIIVLENIYKKLERGENPKQAAILGTKEVLFAVLASTISLLAIFIPIVFMSGIIGRFFQSFAVVVVFGVLISYVVSVYITPMLCARYLKYSRNTFFLFKWSDRFFIALQIYYRKSLTFILKFNNIAKLGLVIGVFVLGFLVVKVFSVPVEFTPQDDYSNVRISIEAPEASSVYYTTSKAKEVEAILLTYKEVDSISTRIFRETNKAFMNVYMVPIKERNISQSTFINILRDKLSEVVGTKIRVASGRSSGGPGGAKVSLTITSSNLDSLYQNTTQLMAKYADENFIGTVDYGFELTPRTKMIINKDLSSIVNISPLEISKMISVLLNGTTIGNFTRLGDSNRYDIILKSNDRNNSYATEILNMYVASNNKLYKLNNFVTFEDYLGYKAINRTSLLYSTSIDIDPQEGFDTITATTRAVDMAKDFLPSDFTIDTQGNAKELGKTIVSVFFAFGLSVVLLYMVLASQFNSLIQPFALMMPIPLAIFGALFSLSITGYSLNIYSMIGMILLVGLVVKNSILLIDLANELRHKGISIVGALLIACPRRLRPILMTSLTVILTMVPAVLSTAEGSVSNASLAVVVIGGMVVSTFLTLFVIPLIYFLVESTREKIANKFRRVSEDNVEEA